MQRAPGNHVSDVIRRLCVRAGKWEERDPDDLPAQIMFEAGNSFEDALADALMRRFARDNPDRYIHGLSVERDGVHGNIDLFDTLDFVVEEGKFTKLSLRHDIAGEKFIQYWWQVKSYCHMIGSPTGRLHICHVMGNWKHDPKDPGAGYQYRCWEDSWTEKELRLHWRMILNNRQ